MEARKWTLVNKYDGPPKLTDFQLVKEALPPLEDGQILVKAEWFSVDPWLVSPAFTPEIGGTMMGSQVGRVVETRHEDFPVGTKILSQLGWRDLSITDPGGSEERGIFTLYKLPDFKGLSESYALGVLGIPGNTAYFGLTGILSPKAGETLVVNGAAGAVGSVVGQVGKILGLQVIGYAGSDEKVNWLKNDLGFDEAFNYKSISDLDSHFKQVAKDGIDCYFDNVGGEFTYHVTRNMKPFGRVALCGAMTDYNKDESKPRLVPFDYPTLIRRNIKMEGFTVTDRYLSQWFDGISVLRDWLLEGKLKTRETIYEGIEQMPRAFIDLFSGKGVGKMIIRAI